VAGGIKARSTRGAIGETWWSKRFLAVLESFSLGGRLTRARNYARTGQVLSLDVEPGAVAAVVQGSRPKPYQVSIGLARFPDQVWRRIEAALAEQALFSARLLAGEMPPEIEAVCAAAGAPLFPGSVGDLVMSCSCPDWQVPCKHIAATFYLLAESFDTDPFGILLWRGRPRDTLLARLRELRTGADGPDPPTGSGRRANPRVAGPPAGSAASPDPAAEAEPAIGSAAVLADLADVALADSRDRFFLPPVPLPAQPPTLAGEPDLLLRQLSTPGPELGGAGLTEHLRRMYLRFTQPRWTAPEPGLPEPTGPEPPAC
jgi:uncharacterized Zn finger protein